MIVRLILSEDIEMFRIENLWVAAGEKEILRGINMNIGAGEVVALLGPNGSGKSVLMQTIIGDPKYRVIKGSIFLDDKNITNLTSYERARLGIGIMMQIPPKIKGIKLIQLLTKMCRMYDTDINYIVELAEKIGANILLNRDLNVGFSGGEMKKAEVLLLAAQRPKLSLIDEPDSGVDLESLPAIGRVISDILNERNNLAYEKPIGIIVTHTGNILKYITEVNRAFIILEGKIVCFGNPMAVLRDIEKYGFDRCYNRLKREGIED